MIDKKKYKIAFCGLGSIGKRHLINTIKFLTDSGYSAQCDWIQSSQRLIDDELRDSISNVYLYNEASDDYDIVFITNPTFAHYETIRLMADRTRCMFIEKPVFSSSDVGLSELHLSKDGVYYVACPLRYAKVISYVKEKIDCTSVYSARAISSSYLPDWRKGVDYRDVYSAKRNLGGGVSFDLIHEWDYLTYLFGIPKRVYNVCGKYSNLEIDSDDLSIYIAEYKICAVELHLDYFGRKSIRQLQLFLPGETIEIDILSGIITYLNEGKVIDLSESRDSFQLREIEYFFSIVNGWKENNNTIPHALEVLKIAEGKL
jgi:predicted dehydrogenase